VDLFGRPLRPIGEEMLVAAFPGLPGALRKQCPRETTGPDAAPRLGGGGMGLVAPRAAPIFTGAAPRPAPTALIIFRKETTLRINAMRTY